MTSDEVAIWWARLEGASAESFEGILRADELARAARFRFRADRERFVIARGLLRRLLGEYLALDPAAIELVHEEHGKPRLAADDAGLRFNVSHSKALVLVALCEGREIGVDVEEIRERRATDAIAGRYLPPQDAQEIQRLTGDEKTREFFRVWTRMEAYAKARGSGLDLLGESPDPERWSIVELTLVEGYAAAVAVEGDAPVRIRSQEFPLDQP